MILLATAIFVFCFWAIFSRKFPDGIVTKNLLAFAAITAWLAIADPNNYYVLAWSLLFLGAGMVYWICRKHKFIPPHPKRRIYD